MNLKKVSIFISLCLASNFAAAQCESNAAGQKFCVGDTVYTQYDVMAEVTGFSNQFRPEVVVLEGKEKGELQIFESHLLYSTKQDCILEFCIGTLVRREEQTGFTRKVVGLNKVQNTVMYENERGKKYAVRPGQLIAEGGPAPRPNPTPAPNPSPRPTPGPAPTPVSGTWSADNLGLIDGTQQAQAAIASEANDTSLILSCKAPSQDMSLKIKMDDSFAAKAIDAIEDQKKLLVVQLIVDEEAIELTNWKVENNLLVAQTDALYPDEVSRIKRGRNLKAVILVDQDSGNDKEEIIHRESFSLKGSNTAITLAEQVCLDGGK